MASLLLLALLGCAPQHRLSLYETAPVETTLDHADLPEAAQVWLDVVTGAERSLDLAFFYASDAPGSRLQPVVLALEAAASRGVVVRFLADRKFHDIYPQVLDRLDSRDGITVRLLDLDSRTGGVLHAKYIVVDDRKVLLGSHNFDWRSLEHVQELGVEIEHPGVVDVFEHIFTADWILAGGGEVITPRDEPDTPFEVVFEGERCTVQPVASPQGLLPDEGTWDLPALVGLIDGAQRRVRVQLLSYTTKQWGGGAFVTLDQALRRAAARGVQVELLLSHWSTRRSQIGTLQELQRVANFSIKLATIPEHSSGFIPYARVTHSKFMTVDGQAAWVGTGNWGGDYFNKSRNLGLIVHGDAFARRLDGVFEDLWESPYTELVDPERRYPEPRYKQ